MQPIEATFVQLARSHQGDFYLGKTNEYTASHDARKIGCDLLDG